MGHVSQHGPIAWVHYLGDQYVTEYGVGYTIMSHVSQHGSYCMGLLAV